jgi:hypothetical protein
LKPAARNTNLLAVAEECIHLASFRPSGSHQHTDPLLETSCSQDFLATESQSDSSNLHIPDVLEDKGGDKVELVHQAQCKQVHKLCTGRTSEMDYS